MLIARISWRQDRRSASRSQRGVPLAFLLGVVLLPAFADGEHEHQPERLERKIQAAIAEQDCGTATATTPHRLIVLLDPSGGPMNGTVGQLGIALWKRRPGAFGGRDGGLRLWNTVQPRWTQAGIPLTVNVVAGKVHEWLLDPPHVAKLEEWLDRLPEPQRE